MKRSPLSRGKPLARGAPMSRGSGLSRAGRLAPVSARKRAAIAAEAPHRPLADPEFRAALYARSRGVCEVTGQRITPDGWDPHHRRRQSQAGANDDPSNLLVVCRAAHDRIHRNVRWAQDRGYLLRTGETPTATPFWRGYWAWVPELPDTPTVDRRRPDRPPPQGDPR